MKIPTIEMGLKIDEVEVPEPVASHYHKVDLRTGGSDILRLEKFGYRPPLPGGRRLFLQVYVSQGIAPNAKAERRGMILQKIIEELGPWFFSYAQRIVEDLPDYMPPVPSDVAREYREGEMPEMLDQRKLAPVSQPSLEGSTASDGALRNPEIPDGR